ncbi:MAG: CopG family transcriptional regulator [Proteobacteria bacterium SG_bin5]|nr:MAG: CopG family transcriptional regulator [Proteobacteria bacterium SG_bin5]
MTKQISVEEFDRLFDDGEDISDYVDWENARRPGLEPQRVEIDFPAWMVKQLDDAAEHYGVDRASLVKLWVGQRLEARG